MKRSSFFPLPLGLALLTLALPSPAALHAEVRVSEFSARNTRAFPDITDFEDYPDWIELQNTGSQAVSLNGAFLSDNPDQPLKWAFPASATIPAYGFLVVSADKHGTSAGQSAPRGYWPWKNFVTERHHTNFALSAAGGAVLFTQTASAEVTPLVRASTPTPEPPATTAVWRFLDDNTAPAEGWKEQDFDDAHWKSGPARLGYGDPAQTVVGFGPNGASKYVTTYFRHSFEIPAQSTFQSLVLSLVVDDGAVVYLNGQEVVRRNMPDGPISKDTLANVTVGAPAETQFFSYTLDPALLVAGSNLIAVEVHQVSPSSSDLGFDLALEGSVPSVTSSQTVTYTPQVADVSYGLDPADPTVWRFFAHPTPGAENSGAFVEDIRTTAPGVTASLPGGSYGGAQTLALSAASGQIRYTLDGSDPKPQSSLYSGPLSLTGSTVLRARAFVDGQVPGPILTRSYFIGEPNRDLPVVSVVAPPETLFGNVIGIYRNLHESVTGGYGLSDVYKGKDAPGHVEFFDSDGTQFRANCGIRIGGENNWVHPQKALNLALSSRYGESDFRYPLFKESPVVVHSSFTLRDGGDNWEREMLRDGLFPKLAHGHLRAETADYRPSVVYINGAYYGLHDVRERWDDTWFFQKYHLPVGGVDHLLLGHITGPDVTLGVDKGDSQDWLDLIAQLTQADLTQATPWAQAEARIDMDSFMDFVVAESYGNNSSWLHNREFWREKSPGAKWKWLLTDMDRTFSSGLTTGVLAQMLSQEDILSKLQVNAQFRKRLAQRYAIHMASTFAVARVHSLITEMETEIPAEEIARHQTRWSPDGMTAESRADGISEMKSYAQTRASNIYAELVSELDVPAPVTLNFSVTGSGSVSMEGIPVPASSFKVFPGVQIRLSAAPAPGFTFAGWTGANGGANTVATFNASSALIARFVPSTETLLGGTIGSNTTLSLAQSPYALSSDLVIAAGATLTVPPGVAIRVAGGQNIRVLGRLNLQGSASRPIQLSGRNNERWGGISFENPSGPSTLSHVVIRGATSGTDPATYPAAISGLNATLTLEFLDIDASEGPVFCRGGDVTLRDSILHNPHSGDCINVKQGKGKVQRCTFFGNNAPDTDAIDFDGVADGLIEENRFYRFRGPNSDGIDVGEECSNLLVQGNLIYFNSDKGVSIGQGSTALLRRNLIVGCALGVGIKDAGSTGTIDQNSFVDCDVAVAVYEKNFAMGGGTALLTNNIFSGSKTAPITADARSSVVASYCLSDTATIAGATNFRAQPRFVAPLALNFQLLAASPAIDSGDPAHAADPDGTRADIGARYQFKPGDYPFPTTDSIVINEVLSNPSTGTGWIELHNRSSATFDISSWWLSNDPEEPAKYQIASGTIFKPGAFLIFKEATHFGPGSRDAGCIAPFSLKPAGQTLCLNSRLDDTLSSYQTQVTVGPSRKGETLGQYRIASSDTPHFIALQKPTPGAANSLPRSAPIVISEIYSDSAQPGDPEEFIELLNTSSKSVTLYDESLGKPWRISGGVEFVFPSQPALTMAPNERIIVAKNLNAFQVAFGAALPSGVRLFQWTSGNLDDGGEALSLEEPNPEATSGATNAEEAEALFAGQIPVLNIVMSQQAIDQLRLETDWTSVNSYVEVTLEEQGGKTYEHVGLKLKGSVGSFRTIDDKPAFSLNTDKYPGAKRFHGLDRFVLNNCAQDASALHELIAGESARKAGVPASRCTHAIVKLNNQRLLGIYVLKEGFSKDFLSSLFDRVDGHLYDGGFLSDVNLGMELDRGNPAQQERLQALVDAINDPTPETQLQRLRQTVEQDAFLKYLAFENILCHWDGYSFNINNYRIYENPATGRFHFILHGMDQTFGGWGSIRSEPRFEASVARIFWSNPGVRARYDTLLTPLVRDCIQPYNWNTRAQEIADKVSAVLQPIDPDLAAQYQSWATDGRNQIVNRFREVLEQVRPGSTFGNLSPAPLPPGSSPLENSSPKYLLVDRVRFDRNELWPEVSPSLSLTRVTEAAYGNDPANWSAAPVSPGNRRMIPITLQSADPTRGSVDSALSGTTQHLPGKTLSVKATAKPGFIFSGWTGSLNSIQNPLPISVTTPITLSAHFIPVPFTAGAFSGRLEGSGVAGSWSLTVNSSGSVSGVVLMNGVKTSIRGAFNGLGQLALSLQGGKMTVTLAQNFASEGSGQISGSIQSGASTANLTAAPLPKFTRNAPCSLQGSHNLLLRPAVLEPPPAPPKGTGYAVATVSNLGACRFAGSLADGTVFLFSAPLHSDFTLPLGLWMPKRGGSLSGTLAFTQTPPETVSGSILWSRLPDLGAKPQPWKLGFSTELSAVGSRWVAPASGNRLLSALDSSNGTATVSITGPEMDLTTQVAVSTTQRVTESPITPAAIALSLSGKTGGITGSFHPPGAANSLRLKFRGLSLQSQSVAEGFYLDRQSPEKSGRIVLSPTP